MFGINCCGTQLVLLQLFSFFQASTRLTITLRVNLLWFQSFIEKKNAKKKLTCFHKLILNGFQPNSARVSCILINLKTENLLASFPSVMAQHQERIAPGNTHAVNFGRTRKKWRSKSRGEADRFLPFSNIHSFYHTLCNAEQEKRWMLRNWVTCLSTDISENECTLHSVILIPESLEFHSSNSCAWCRLNFKIGHS